MAEWIAYVLLLAFLGTRRTTRAILTGLTRGRRAYLVTLVLALVAGHLLDRSAATFPFVTWAMYSAPVPAGASYYEYTIIRRSGREEPLPVAQVFPGLSTRLVHRLRMLADEIQAAPAGAPRSDRLTEYARLLAAIGRRYDGAGATDPVQVVQVWYATVETSPERQVPVARQRLWLVTVGPGA